MARKKKYIGKKEYFEYSLDIAKRIHAFKEDEEPLTKELFIHLISQDEFGPLLMAYTWGKNQQIKDNDPAFEIGTQELVDEFWKEPKQEEGAIDA